MQIRAFLSLPLTWPVSWRWRRDGLISFATGRAGRQHLWRIPSALAFHPIADNQPTRPLYQVLRRLDRATHNLLDGYIFPCGSETPFRIIGHRLQDQKQRRNEMTVAAGLLWPTATPARRENECEAQLRALIDAIESLPEAFILYDADDRLVIANSAYSELYPTVADIVRPGVRYETILDVSVARGQFQTGPDVDEWKRRRLEFHRRREGLFEQHLADGRWIQVSERPTASGGTTSIRADITLLKRREAELHALNSQLEAGTRAKTRFLSMLSHELRTPMNGILGIVQSLLTDNLTPDQRTRLEIMLGSVRMLTALLDDMLDVSRIEAGRLELKPEAVSLPRLFEDVVSVVWAQAELSGITLRWQLARGMPSTVVVDHLRLRQIVLNFLSNAVRYTPVGGVTIKARRMPARDIEAERLRIEVHDTGAGISAADQERLFLPFERGDRSWAEVPEGMGLGLAICRELAAAMGGRIGVFSRLGKGSCFWVELPLQIASVDKPATTSHVVPPGPALRGAAYGTPLHVLVVDDDSVNRLVAQLLLEKLGRRVTLCADGEAGLARLAAGDIDIVLLDISMPSPGGTGCRLEKAREANLSSRYIWFCGLDKRRNQALVLATLRITSAMNAEAAVQVVSSRKSISGNDGQPLRCP